MMDKDGEAYVRADIVDPEKYSKSDAPYFPADSAVNLLAKRVEAEPECEALDVLAELAGNYFNKLAFNQLYAMGKMADQTDDTARQGWASYMIEAWKKRDAEKLKIIAFWSYPTFTYSEYDPTNQLIKKIEDEEEFVDALISEMDDANKNNQQIRMRMRKQNADYLVDVMIGTRISTFQFLYSETSFLGINRYWQS